ncbi:MAG TPA: hypothetical protein VGN63_12335 [Flavisolibacter sp.]|jgi:hypothetical protein|nr:hypothetical protein [Flavisolibacter sp.]
MNPVVLYFKDGINLKAFVLVENLRTASVKDEQFLLLGDLTETQITKACLTYGAALHEFPDGKHLPE